MKKLLIVFLMVAIALTGAFGQKVFELKLAHADSTDPTVSRKQAQALAFASLVNSRAGGRLVVKVYGAGSLGAEREYVEGIRAGTVEAGIASGVIANFFPSAAVTDIPFLFPTSQVAWDVMDGAFGDKLRALFLKETGMRALAFAEVGFRHFTNNVRPIKSPADLKGLKIRVQETPVYVNMLRAVGASPTPVAWTETYTALQTGVVDGQENPVGSILSGKIFEVQKYVTLDGHVYGVDWFIINEKFFKSLPADLQYIVLDSAQASGTVGRGVLTYINAAGIQVLVDNKLQIYAPTEDEMDQFKKAMQPAVIDYLKTRMDPALITDVQKAVADAVAEQKAKLK
ncbi:MAG: DctP family TRAP transporter solute-binding subunit [Rectinemataceae bacterium]|nr:DctP family TRAP transporter solute-binding subunit [Rectinemataceae bacterium]